MWRRTATLLSPSSPAPTFFGRFCFFYQPSQTPSASALPLQVARPAIYVEIRQKFEGIWKQWKWSWLSRTWKNRPPFSPPRTLLSAKPSLSARSTTRRVKRKWKRLSNRRKKQRMSARRTQCYPRPLSFVRMIPGAIVSWGWASWVGRRRFWLIEAAGWSRRAFGFFYLARAVPYRFTISGLSGSPFSFLAYNAWNGDIPVMTAKWGLEDIKSGLKEWA